MFTHKTQLALYIHWPYCLSKCPYCDFNSHVAASINHDIWRKAYEADLRAHAQKLGQRHITSIFFGGGTPSLMAPETVAHVIETAQQLWDFTPDIEITMEANPTSIEAQKFKDFKTAGINRVSVGVQSLNDTDLKALGREHSADEALKAIDIAAHTFERFSFDLIYTREGQTLSAWEEELRRALPFASGGHLSLYQLTIEPGTQFKTLFDSGRLILPNEDDSARFYELTNNIMHSHNMPLYEISNYARAGQESRHNMTYWRYGDYAGIGPGAHGRLRVPQSEGESQLRVPQSEGESRLRVPQSEAESRLRVPQSEAESRLRVPQSEGESRLRVPQSEGESRLRVPQGEGESRLRVPQSEDESRLRVPQSEDESRLRVPQSEGESHPSHTITWQTVATRGHKAPEKWLEYVLRDTHMEAPFQNAHSLTAQDQMEEMALVGLRLREGLSFTKIKQRTGLDLQDYIVKNNLKMLVAEGLALYEEENIRLTDKGLPLLDGITAALLA